MEVERVISSSCRSLRPGRSLLTLPIDFFLDSPLSSIDPYSTAYWQPEPVTTQSSASNGSKSANCATTTDFFGQGRAPLKSHQNSGNSAASASSTSATAATTTTTTMGPPPSGGISSRTNNVANSNKRFVGPDVMDEFKQEIEGSDLTKIALIEALKKRYVVCYGFALRIEGRRFLLSVVYCRVVVVYRSSRSGLPYHHHPVLTMSPPLSPLLLLI